MLHEADNNALRLLQDKPFILSGISKRMVFRLFPYVMPSSIEDFASAGVGHSLGVFRLMLLARIIHQTPGISFRRTGSAGLTAAF
ncbi:MAG: hypothetical protein Q9M48_01435 [Rhodobacterales bacterium]|nr:hypothetical protein [Rhodobacterales bacterium]